MARCISPVGIWGGSLESGRAFHRVEDLVADSCATFKVIRPIHALQRQLHCCRSKSDSFNSMMKVTHLNPSELPDWSSLFSQVVIAEGSPIRVIAVSGQVGVDRNQAVSGDGSFAAQLDSAFRNLV